MLNQIMDNTIKYLSHFPKSMRKDNGQFFTSVPTAQFMASLTEVHRSDIKILDAGCGNAMLAAAVIDYILPNENLDKIDLTLFDTDTNIHELLQENLALIEELCRNHNVELSVRFIPENFILHYANIWKDKEYLGEFDIAICNPPYLKIGKDSVESVCMSDIVHGQPNIYFLFMAMSTHLLKQDGQLVFIIPRSWTSGLYFKKFRQYLLTNLNIERLHLFESRDKVFSTESVLQETMILSGKKSPTQDETITISSCQDANDYHNLHRIEVSSSICFPTSDNNYVLIPSDKEDVDTLQLLSKLSAAPKKLGFQFKTGQVVEFRNRENLRYRKGKYTIPLIQACNIINGKVALSVKTDKPQYFLVDESHEKMCIENCNTVILKRFTSKEEQRRLQPAVHLKQSHPEIKYFTTENHVNYLVKADGVLSVCEVYGFYVILSSDIWDRYYRILNGSTQVNSEELNTMPIPDLELLQHIGQTAIHCLKTNNKIDSNDIIRSILA